MSSASHVLPCPDCGKETEGTMILLDLGAGDVRSVHSAYCPDHAGDHSDA